MGRTLEAAAKIPFYLDHFEGRPTFTDFQNLPILQRVDLERLNQSVRTLNPPDTVFQAGLSSGSTGIPTETIFDEPHQRGRFAARARYLCQNGWNPLSRNAWVICPQGQTPDGRLMRSRSLLGKRFLSVFDDFEAQLDWLVRIDPFYLYTYPSNLNALLHLIEATGKELPALRRIFTGGEVLEDHVRSRAKRILGVDVADNYGTTEAFPAWQCPHGSYHINTEHAYLEIVDRNGKKVAPGEIGRVILTTLENYLMPLVRYDVGDLAIASDKKCSCGRTLPLIERVIGRSINLFRLKDGHLMTPWELFVQINKFPAWKQFQIIQKDVDQYEVRYVTASPVDEQDKDQCRRVFYDIIGESININFVRVPEIARAASGKFMSAISELAE